MVGSRFGLSGCRGTLISLLVFAIAFSTVVGIAALSPAAEGKPSSTSCPIKRPAPSSIPFEGARLSERVFGLPGLKNVGRVAPGIYRGAMPEPEGYATLRRMGIRTVVNLRTTETERKQVEAAGMRSVEIPMEMLGNGDRDKVERVLDVMSDRARQPVFVHCKLGEDRTGIVVAAYRMKMEGWPLELAEAEMETFGFNGVWVNLRRFLHRYAAELERRKH